MNEQLEIEFKLLLTKDIYQQILLDFKEDIINTYTQTNYYLSHPLLDSLQYMLRIREKLDTYELTLKRKADIGNIETNIIINKDIKEQIFTHQKVDNEIFTILKLEGIDCCLLQCLYTLTTKRIDIKHPLGLLSLDDNQYNGKQDYELEFEVLDFKQGKEAFLQLIDVYHLSYTSNCPSKIQRVKQSL